MRLLAAMTSALSPRRRAIRAAVPGGTRRDFFGDRLATFDELRAADARAHASEASVPASVRPPVRHVA